MRLGLCGKRIKSNWNKKNHNTINQHIEQNHATKIFSNTPTLVAALINYIPRHAVVNQNKPNKLRVVYDAAAKCKNLVSILTCYPEQFQKQITLFLQKRNTSTRYFAKHDLFLRREV